MRLRTVIADDEPLAVTHLCAKLATIDDLEVVAIARDGAGALEAIRRHRPNLLILDIAMPNLTGIDVVEAVDDADPPAVIFISAHDQFAVDAFRTGATDYLLKPLDPERLRQAIDRVRLLLQQRSAEQRIGELRQVVTALRKEAQRRREQDYEDSFWVSSRGQLSRVMVRDVLWFGSEGDYVRIHTDAQQFLIHESLRSLEQRLDPDRFVRVHRQAIVALAAVASLQRLAFGAVRLNLANGDAVNVGRYYRDALQSILARPSLPSH